LQRSELERACEDFSNIVASYPHYTVYKGTLSTGVEIAVVSTMITSSKEWSEHSETCFRRKVIIRIWPIYLDICEQHTHLSLCICILA
jgi:hypothetical protein